jgi:hypothetical protein
VERFSEVVNMKALGLVGMAASLALAVVFETYGLHTYVWASLLGFGAHLVIARG